MTYPDDVDAPRRRAPDAETLRLAVPVATPHDARVCAVVLLSPGLGFFGAPSALAEVTARLFVRVGALDPICPPQETEHALRSRPATTPLDLAIVPNAGHFSFLSPFPPELAHLPPAQDPSGFDRAAYAHVLATDVSAFLREAFA